MRKPITPLLLLIGLVTLSGCGALVSGTSGSTAAKAPASQESFTLVTNPGVSPLAILSGSEKIKIGDPYFRWESVFPRPKKAAFEIQELPKPLSQDDLQPVGWESSNRGYGAIRNGRRLVLAMIWQSKVTQDEASKIKNDYYLQNETLPSMVISENGSTYTFWESNQIRMMLLVQKTGSDAFNVTVALGQSDLMTAIRASVDQAQSDLAGLSPSGGVPKIKIVPAVPAPIRSSSSSSSTGDGNHILNSNQGPSTAGTGPGATTKTALPSGSNGSGSVGKTPEASGTSASTTGNSIEGGKQGTGDSQGTEKLPSTGNTGASGQPPNTTSSGAGHR